MASYDDDGISAEGGLAAVATSIEADTHLTYRETRDGDSVCCVSPVD